MSVSQPTSKFNEEWDASQRGSSIIDGLPRRSSSVVSPEKKLLSLRGVDLKKTAARRGSIKKSSSRRSSRAGSVRSLVHQSSDGIDEKDSIFFSPVPANENPTDLLANRFEAWRKILKDIIIYFREIQASYEQRAKSLQKISNVIKNTTIPPGFLQSGGIRDATCVLGTYYKTSINEAGKSNDIGNEVILTLTGLRSDLKHKIKEIKNLSGDFKNSLEKEMESARKALNELQESLRLADIDSAYVTGKRDPYLLKLATDNLVEKQIAEENYLHEAYLNLEASGRELEAIVVGEIQKSYSAFANILLRETEVSNYTFEKLHTGPIAMPKDQEWNHFIKETDNFVDPDAPMRYSQNIKYPGRDDELVQEIRTGLLERKSKYLKSYTAGWYVLTPTHLHEFKSTDKSQAPVMSLNLSEQKLRFPSKPELNSNKFLLKGRQTGMMHRGHTWVFRCESHETMMSWYETLKALIEKSPQESSTLVRRHVRNSSGTCQTARSICSSDEGLDDDEEEPLFSKNTAIKASSSHEKTLVKRPQAGGRFPSSDLQLNKPRHRDTDIVYSPSSENSSFDDVQASNQKIPKNTSGEEACTEPFALLNQNTEVDNVTFDVDKKTPNLKPMDLHGLTLCQDHNNVTSKRPLESGGNEIQQADFGQIPKISEIEKIHVTIIDSAEDKSNNVVQHRLHSPNSPVWSGHTYQNPDKISEHVKNETPMYTTLCVELEKENCLKAPRRIVEESGRLESPPHVPGEWLKEKHMTSKTAGAEEK